uniref:Uncharacterized protein n=1 Tax=Oryza nivara TaxID=4536 RepID=A0A0E0IKA4_ORYNI
MAPSIREQAELSCHRWRRRGGGPSRAHHGLSGGRTRRGMLLVAAVLAAALPHEAEQLLDPLGEILAEERIARGVGGVVVVSGLPHCFLARSGCGDGSSTADLGESSAAVWWWWWWWSGSSDTDREWWRRRAAACASWSRGGGGRLGLAVAASLIGGTSCTLGVGGARSRGVVDVVVVAPPVPLPRRRNGRGVTQSPKSDGTAPRLLRLRCAGFAAAAPVFTVLALGSTTAELSFLGVVGVDTPGGDLFT